jgi:hypothetical protein
MMIVVRTGVAEPTKRRRSAGSFPKDLGKHDGIVNIAREGEIGARHEEVMRGVVAPTIGGIVAALTYPSGLMDPTAA